MNIFLNTVFLFLFTIGSYCSQRELITFDSPLIPVEKLYRDVTTVLEGAFTIKCKQQKEVDSSLVKTNFLHALPGEISVIIAHFSDDINKKYLLFSKEKIRSNDSIYYNHVLKPYLEKIVHNRAIEELKSERYEKNIAACGLLSELQKKGMVSALFITALDNCYRGFIDNEHNVLSYCHANLFTFAENKRLKTLCPKIETVNPDDIFTSDEGVSLETVVLAKKGATYTLHRIMTNEDFLEYIDRKSLDQTLVKRVIMFKKYQSDLIRKICTDNKYFWLFDVIRDKKETPLLCECIYNKNRLSYFMYTEFFIRTVIEKGVNVNVADSNGYTPLHNCVLRGYYDIAKLLIEKGTYVNAKTIRGDSPLHVAALNGYMDMVRLLVEKGADINARNDEGKTPVDGAGDNILVQSYLVRSKFERRLIKRQDLSSEELAVLDNLMRETFKLLSRNSSSKNISI